MDKYFLSVIIPAYNSEDRLAKCVNSILNQKINNYEIIIINDGSTDRTYAICNSFSEKYENIRSYHIENKGVSNARNIGIKKSKGEYLHFVDSDDILDINMYGKYKNIINEYKYDIVISGRKDVYKNKIVNIKSDKIYNAKTREIISSFLSNLKVSDKVWALNTSCNKWFKKKIIIQNNIKFPLNICPGEDFCFVVDFIIKSHSLYVFNESFYNYYKINENSLVSKFYDDLLYRRSFVLKKHKLLYKSYEILEKYNESIHINEGKMIFHELLSVYNKESELSISEKINYLKTIVDSEHFDYIYSYLGNHRFKLMNLTNYIYKTKNPILIISHIYFFSFIIKLKKILGNKL